MSEDEVVVCKHETLHSVVDLVLKSTKNIRSFQGRFSHETHIARSHALVQGPA